MYNRGTLTEFNTWHNTCRAAYDLLDGVIYSFTTAHPTNADDYIWAYAGHPEGTSLSLQDTIDAGFVVNA